MLVNSLLGIMIFGYSGYMFYRHIQKSKQGKCAACAIKDACYNETACTSPRTNYK
jgi:hypothetical protein